MEAGLQELSTHCEHGGLLVLDGDRDVSILRVDTRPLPGDVVVKLAVSLELGETLSFDFLLINSVSAFFALANSSQLVHKLEYWNRAVPPRANFEPLGFLTHCTLRPQAGSRC